MLAGIESELIIALSFYRPDRLIQLMAVPHFQVGDALVRSQTDMLRPDLRLMEHLQRFLLTIMYRLLGILFGLKNLLDRALGL
jgi:hypothetical protein